MLVSELIEWLKTQNQDDVIQVVEGDEVAVLDINKHVFKEDFRNYSFPSSHPFYNRRVILLGY
jgi:hypothetical protein